MIRVAFCIGGYPPEEYKRRADLALSYANSDIQVGIINVEASPYFYGITPTEIQLVGPAYIDAYRRAEKEGYDAPIRIVDPISTGVQPLLPGRRIHPYGKRKAVAEPPPVRAVPVDDVDVTALTIRENDASVAQCANVIARGDSLAGFDRAELDLFGREKVGSLFAVLTVGWGLIGGLGPIIWGIIFDTFGSYSPALLVSALCFIVALVALLLIRPPADRSSHD